MYVAKQQPAKGGISHEIKHEMCEQKIRNLKGRSRVKTHIHPHRYKRKSPSKASKPPQPKRTLHAKQCQPASIVSRQASKQATTKKEAQRPFSLPSMPTSIYNQIKSTRPNKETGATRAARVPKTHTNHHTASPKNSLPSPPSLPLRHSQQSNHLLSVCIPSSSSSSSRLPKDDMTVLNQELHRNILGVHVRHLLLEAVVPHDSGREHDRQVLRGHLFRKKKGHQLAD